MVLACRDDFLEGVSVLQASNAAVCIRTSALSCRAHLRMHATLDACIPWTCSSPERAHLVGARIFKRTRAWTRASKGAHIWYGACIFSVRIRHGVRIS